MANFKVIVDRAGCIACGLAPNLCAQVFVMGEDNGKNRIVGKYSEKTSNDESVGMVPEDLLECVKEAAQACPVQAIVIETN